MNQDDSAKFILDLRHLEIAPADCKVTSYWREMLPGDFMGFSSLEEAIAFAEEELERIVERTVRSLRCQLMQNLAISCGRIRHQEQAREDG